MKQLTFPLPSYYIDLFKRTKVISFQRLISKCGSYYDEDFVLCFVEFSILILATDNRLIFSREILEQLRSYWKLNLSKHNRLSSYRNIGESTLQELQALYSLITSEKIDGLTLEVVEDMILLEIGFAEYRFIKEQDSIFIENPCILYGSNRYYVKDRRLIKLKKISH